MFSPPDLMSGPVPYEDCTVEYATRDPKKSIIRVKIGAAQLPADRAAFRVRYSTSTPDRFYFPDGSQAPSGMRDVTKLLLAFYGAVLGGVAGTYCWLALRFFFGDRREAL